MSEHFAGKLAFVLDESEPVPVVRCRGGGCVGYAEADAETAARHVRERADRISELERNIGRARLFGHPTQLA